MLSDAQAVSLASHLAPYATPGVGARLVEVAGGNPLFLEELTASLSDATTEDLGLIYPGCTRNYVSDPQSWFSMFKVSGDERGPLWRVLSSTR